MSEVQLVIASGAWGRDEALKALRSKYAAWLDNIGTPTLYALCKTHEFFTTDEVWDAFGQYPSPVERRVMGALIRAFALRGLIAKTGVSEKSRMPACHARDKALWQSQLYVAVRGGMIVKDGGTVSEWKATL